ncbi:hypothetical protein Ddc_14521 [Ditylenchus destructor]|nr:hypothetical protein Ddc_14521 [Ditylenchus destructor]
MGNNDSSHQNSINESSVHVKCCNLKAWLTTHHSSFRDIVNVTDMSLYERETVIDDIIQFFIDNSASLSDGTSIKFYFGKDTPAGWPANVVHQYSERSKQSQLYVSSKSSIGTGPFFKSCSFSDQRWYNIYLSFRMQSNDDETEVEFLSIDTRVDSSSSEGSSSDVD